MINDRTQKIKALVDTMTPQQSDIHKQFINILSHDRSVLLVWLLSQRLHKESKNNDLWKRFLLNQDLFQHNIRNNSSLVSERLNFDEMLQFVGKDKREIIGND